MKFHFLSLAIAVFIATTGSYTATQAQDVDSATTSGLVDPEVVKENVRRRIQEVIKGDSDIASQPTAYAGTLSSLTDNTLTIATLQGTQLASASADTVYVTIPGSKPADVNDLTIDGYVAVLGYMNGTGVLDSRRILIHAAEPSVSDDRSFFGRISEFDDGLVTLENSVTGQQLELKLVRTSDLLNATAAGNTITAEEEDIIKGKMALAIYRPEDQPAESTLSILLLGQLIDAKDYQTATSSADDLPPELQP
jgi:hypothetical protein